MSFSYIQLLYSLKYQSIIRSLFEILGDIQIFSLFSFFDF
ncbi:hypothetical protein Cabys_2320 [Caldithrix abyssi DSM 13497]|uniref:Uncharacterized protein n=1 Tax=Caldithrix abyssi DSM 13497 TaxID=880073 RepID=A0A1J1C8P2_CALAY|nr:hypothetical protein Cabys_2320 [Caldithrix abyssi DSM 13497]